VACLLANGRACFLAIISLLHSLHFFYPQSITFTLSLPP
jgi:hypothetical protein